MSLALFALTASSCAADRSWDGRISDDTCNGLHDWDEHSAPMTEQECTLACIRAGAKYVFMSDGQTYSLLTKNTAEGRDRQDLADYAGRPVRILGRLQDKTITVTRVEFP